MIASLRYEWRRISTIRSTWILLAAAVALSGGFGLLYSFLLGADLSGDQSGGQPAEFTMTLVEGITQSAGNLLVLVILSTIAAQAIGQDYRHGTIRVTLTEFPNRTTVFLSKIIIALAAITVGFILSVVLSGVILSAGGNTMPGSEDAVGSIVRAWLYVLGFCLIAFALTAITRVLALGVVIPLVLAAVLEPLISALVSSYVEWLPDALPFAAGTSFIAGTDVARSGLVFAAWTFGLAAVAYVMFTRRDA
ncbi:MAG: ABC transporter permease [Actinobacteria bacterium]|nr:ABC transporter permease [Actinomycetota bacterium]